MKRYEAGDCNVETLLNEAARYRVPRYQRPYSWEEDQVQDFWDDLLDEQDTNFIGAVILNEEYLAKERVIDIIDGQQRLLTTAIFYAVLRDCARALPGGAGAAFADRLQRQRLAHEDKRGHQHYKILTGETVKDFFETYIQSGSQSILESTPGPDEHKRVRDNYSLLHRRFNEVLAECASPKEQLETLNDYYDRIDAIGLVRIKIQSESDAYEIFETVNARGVELSVADLLKNLIFRQVLSEPRVDSRKVQAKWLDIEKAFAETDFDVSRFARYYWISRHAFVSEKRLFREVKAKIKDYGAFLDELHASAEALRRLANPDAEELQDYFGPDAQKIASALDGLWAMRTKQWYPLFMCVVRNRKLLGQSVARLFTAIESFSFRYFFTCKLPANKVEKLVAKKASEFNEAVQEGSHDRRAKAVSRVIDSTIEELRKLLPPATVFLQNFGAIEYRQSGAHRIALKYALSRLNNAHGTGELVIDFSQVNIEHLIPQKPSTEWKLTKQDVSRYVNKIGNLTLVHKKINSRIGNKGMSEKLKELGKSEIGLTKSLVASINEAGATWDEYKIAARCEELAQMANNVWKL